MTASSFEEECPRVRCDLDFAPITHQGRQMLLVHDRLGLVQQGTAIPPWVYRFLAVLDGTPCMGDIQQELMRGRQGSPVTREEIRQILAELDGLFLLDTPAFQQARQGLVDAFSKSPVRPSALSGRSYSDNPSEVSGLLDSIMAEAPSQRERSCSGVLKALVSPHIDLAAGRRSYAQAYGALGEERFDRIVVLGIGHHLMNGCYSLTDKTFRTPLGEMEADLPAVETLRSGGGSCLARDDFAHRDEHSIEFQVLFLQHLLTQSRPRLVPILCGSLLAALPSYGRKAFLETAGPFLAALRRVADDPESRTLLVAGVDLSHIGPKFGHEHTAPNLESQASAHDRKLLECLVRQDPEGFWNESVRQQDRFNVCGFSALATLLEVLPSCSGRILDYQMWHEPPTRSAVSFAAAVFVDI